MQVSAGCRGVKTFTGELSLSGRAGAESLRGTVAAGFARPSSMRLEGRAPLGQPAFILVSRGDTATLLLPRGEPRVLRNARAEEVLAALTGVTLGPADLQAVLSGCVSAAPVPKAGRLHGNGLAAIDLDDGATLYLRRVNDRWDVRAARRGTWQIEYPRWQGQFPAAVRLRSSDPVAVDLTAVLSQIEANVDLDAAAFAVVVPPGAETLTLDELRDAGPLRGQ
jgi:hypothetical protein